MPPAARIFGAPAPAPGEDDLSQTDAPPPQRPPVLQGAWRIIAACAIVASVIAFAGGARRPEEAAIWMGESVSGGLIGLLVARYVVPVRWFAGPFWRPAVLIAAAITAPMTLVVLGVNAAWYHRRPSWAAVQDILPSVFLVSLAMTFLAFLLRRHPTATHAAAPDAPPAKFLARLPPKLRGAELYAVEAEDHYLRLHTSAGDDLILMRLSDAIDELEGLEGARTHRSWWVARAAVTDAERGEGRATLTLKNGVSVPVSRGYARALREAGWF
ncbi:MAG TPA: LytTR family DNA-binding domain-containing protein [Caulobacteraceae bacterium]|nr:LytTR family DNA-binding domain-containing protein [Caulobacteraceae bacterium]